MRFGHFNVRDLTAEKLLNPDHPQVAAAAAIIKTVRPDVLSINEIEARPDSPRLFLDNFLHKVDDTLSYPYYYTGPTNSGKSTGLPRPFDMKGFGLFEGQYGIALFSRFPILHEEVRSFESFAWKDFPEGLSCLGGRVREVPEGVPLFSTTLLDVPLHVHGKVMHTVLLHASVPVKGPLNRERNGDQLIFLNEFIGERPLPGVQPLRAGTPFVVMGDLNADPVKGEGVKEAIWRLLKNPALHGLLPPTATYLEDGGVEKPALDPGGFSLKIDYILPSRDFTVLKHEVLLPEERDLWHQARLASDHFMVYADCSLAAG